MTTSVAGQTRAIRSPATIVLLGATAFGIAACASSDASTQASADRYQLVVTAPGLESARPRVSRTTRGALVIERSRWRPDDAEWPRADITFWRISDTFRGTQAFAYEASMPDLIRIYLPGEWITVGAGGQARNVLGTLDYQRFRWKLDIDCVFVRQGVDRFSDQVSLRGPAVFLGDMVIKGWYCIGPSPESHDAEFEAFIRGIGIRGWAVPWASPRL